MEGLIEFFNKCGIICDNVNELDGIQIPRERLLDINIYNTVIIFIPELKKIFSSSSYTALHSKAHKIQRWPLINLVRQTLKAIGYKLEPKRLCDGYDELQNKKYKRIFIIRSLNNKNNNDTM
jgi:hypothetical protein|tara:strand:- start:1380 stop:1745 length:366 start_codon:yes stop_codon:yes gene_type:complete